MEWTEQFDSSLDFPATVDASIKYAICSTPRSGSHFLGQLLYGTGLMGCPLEYFQGKNLLRWQERASAADAGDLVRFLQSIRTSSNGCFGLKAHFPQLRALTGHIPLHQFVSDFAHVHIVRRDLLAQAISFERARQTDEWISRTSTSGRTAAYDRGRIRHCLIEVARQNASWEHLFHAFGLRRLVVEYESLLADPARVVREVGVFVGVDMPADAAIPGPRTTAQRDGDSESWRDRFLAEMRRESSWAGVDVLQHAVSTPPGPAHTWRRWLKTALGH